MFSHLKFSSYRYWQNNIHRVDTDVNTCILLRFFEKIKKRIPFKKKQAINYNDPSYWKIHFLCRNTEYSSMVLHFNFFSRRPILSLHNFSFHTHET